MNKVYSATKLMCDTYAAQIQNTAEDVERWLTHKIKHTFQVTHEIMNIFYFTKEVYEAFDEEDKELVELSAILHDLGRLYQHNKKKILPSEEFEHGAAAVNILKKNELFNNPILLFAIGEHNHYQINYQNPYYINLNEQDKKKAEIIAKLLRDADKLDNIRFTVYHHDCYVDKNLRSGGLSEPVKKYLRARQSVNYDKCSIKRENFTASEYLAGYLGWINDIYFDVSKQIIRDLGFIEFGIAKAEELGASKEDLAFLKKYLVI